LYSGAICGMEQNNNQEIVESIIGAEVLYESMMKCKKGVLWKDSVAHYYLNGIEETLKLSQQLRDNIYVPRPPKHFKITHPKERDVVSIAFRDRVYQRSLNDNQIYPAMTQSLIKTNCACQKGKGTDVALKYLEDYLKKAYRKHGTNFYVLQGDIHKYYDSMHHEEAENCFKRYLHPEVYNRAVNVLREQYTGETGYNPGSQMVQIAGISVLSPLDHFIKEKLRIKWYMRYMDDFILLHEDKEYLEYCYAEIEKFLARHHFKPHPKKTKIYNVKKGIKFLGFTHHITEMEKVIRIVDPQNVKSERKKLRRQVILVKNGLLTKKQVGDGYEAWKAHVKRGNSYKLLLSMDEYYKELWEELLQCV